MNPSEFRIQMFSRYKNHRVPVEGVFELTGRCNLNCKMCYVHTKPNAEFLKTEKSGDWWIEQIDAACEKGMLFALLTGGECLMHPDFRRIYLHLRSKGVYVRVNTNGLLLTENNIEFFKQYPPFEIQLTLYGADEDSFEKVTGARAFHKVKAAIARVKEAGFNLRVSITPNEFAPGETERIIDFLREEKVNYALGEFLFTTYDSGETQTMSGRGAALDERIAFLKKQYGAHPEIAQEKLPPVGGGCTDTVRGIRCGAGRVMFVISHDGCMMPCTAMYHFRVPIDEQTNFDAAWEKMLEFSGNFLLPIECEGCAYKKACFSCVVARSNQERNGHCNPAVCEMTRKLVAAGAKALDQAMQTCE